MQSQLHGDCKTTTVKADCPFRRKTAIRPKKIRKILKSYGIRKNQKTFRNFFGKISISCGNEDIDKLNGKHKIMMSLLKMKLKSMKNRTKNEDDLLKAYDAAEYHCNKDNIRQLTDAVRGL